MECVGVIALSSCLIFARLAMMQELNPFLWGFLAIVAYAAPPVWMIYHGASWMDAPMVWASSFGALFALFVAQCVVAERKRYRNRGGPPGGVKKVRPKAKGTKRKGDRA
jgi:hypothetical protein